MAQFMIQISGECTVMLVPRGLVSVVKFKDFKMSICVIVTS